MKRSLLTYLFILVFGTLNAQVQSMRSQDGSFNSRDRFGNQVDPSRQAQSLNDSVDIQSLPPQMYMWRLEERFGERRMIDADTISLNFQNTNLVEGMYGQYNYLGNLGSPRLSRIFFDRDNDAPTIFMAPLSSFYFTPDQVNFTNSNIPYTNLTYYKGGNKINGEERFKSYFSVNVNKRLAFGFNFDYLYGRGLYSNQSTAYFNAGLFASYIGERYQLQAVYNNFFMKMNENGGITNDGYITRPDTLADGKKEYESNNIPVNLESSSNRNKDFYVYLTHRYRLGFDRTIEKIDTTRNDTTHTYEFVPVTSFIHTMKVERTRRQFSSNDRNFYEHYYFDKSGTRDTTTAFSIKNTFAIALLEGFNRYAKAGLTAYISHKYSYYDLMDSLSLNRTNQYKPTRYKEQEVFIGGELAKRQGDLLHYNINGEVGIAAEAIGEFRLNGDADLNFRLGKDIVNLYARANISNLRPSFYMRHYHSNHFYWDNNNFDKEFKTRIEGELNIDRWGTNLMVGVENIKNYTYFNQQALPQQYGDNLQVMTAQLTQNFKLGILHLDNKVTYQKSSNNHVLPLPELSTYHNLYLLTKIAKQVLTVQLGAEATYFTKYLAPAYTPALQQFHLQSADKQVEIGGYPVVNAYCNLHLKRTRIFVMMYHVNAGMGKRNYFTVPHYPLNPRLLKIGVSWNFYD
ncbi:MAG: putative porin [Bacteroides sp.]|nr:putative porin [Bacteroides sp.]